MNMHNPAMNNLVQASLESGYKLILGNYPNTVNSNGNVCYAHQNSRQAVLLLLGICEECTLTHVNELLEYTRFQHTSMIISSEDTPYGLRVITNS